MCAPYIAAQRVRVSRDGGRTYPRGAERPVTHQLPSQPAAVRVYDATGLTRCLVADFDVKKADLEQVERDAAAFAELVRRCGGRVLEDGSPSGGRHVYVPLSVPVPWGLARRIAQALEARFPSFDKAPMVNQTDGLIRPPGSPHPAGGWQKLLTPRDEVISVLSSRTPPPAFERLARAVGVDPDAAPETGSPSPGGRDAWLRAVSTGPLWGRQRRPLSLEWQLMATKGIRPREWPSDSEARLALLRACARHGWTFRDIASRYESGEWPAFRRLYERYSPANARAALAKDWSRATNPERLKAGPPDGGSRTARRSDTSLPPTHPRPTTELDDAAKVRSWWTVLRSIEKQRWAGRQGLSVRRVLRAIAAAAQNMSSTVVAFGVRSLAEGSGLSHEAVAQVLRRLREEGDPVLVRVLEGEGLSADTYELRVPTAHEGLERLRWRRGRIRPVHPVFRVLGGAAFLVWEVLLEAGSAPASVRDVSADSGVPGRTVEETLRELGELGLVEKRAGGWVAVGSLDEAAAAVGADAVHARVMGEHRRARRVWQSFWQRVRALREGRHPDDRWWAYEEPPPRENPDWAASGELVAMGA